MAYLIFNSDNNIVKIAASDSDRDSQNLILSDHSVVSVSDVDFLKVKTGVVITSYDGTNVNFTDANGSLKDEMFLKSIFQNHLKQLKEFLKGNQKNALYNSLNDYKSTLEDFDTSSITFPLNKTWEQYCNENSITFYHPLQIP